MYRWVRDEVAVAELGVPVVRVGVAGRYRGVSRVLAGGGDLLQLESGGVALLDAVDERLPVGSGAVTVFGGDDVRRAGSGEPAGSGGGDTGAPVS